MKDKMQITGYYIKENNLATDKQQPKKFIVSKETRSPVFVQKLSLLKPAVIHVVA